ncbi:hypothetical protein VTJ83DRAFT_7205 [Remersonia thermophila]|uniref:Enoyl reductase (ER) domain-containing protein n=1 Tax=Remersonia thermophila TaxID=72144 RepID=A0ABR4D2Y2_9PEZI
MAASQSPTNPPLPSVMRAIDIHPPGVGPASSLYINPSLPLPRPGPNQVLVRVHAFGLNRLDLLQREGRYPPPPHVKTNILGVEFSGVVVALGDGDDDDGNNNNNDENGLAIGDEVFGLVPGGAYAEYVAAPRATLLRKPGFLTHVQAAAVPEAWMTATQALDFILGGLGHDDDDDEKKKPRRTILWHAGASGVSLAGIQLSRLAGAAAVFATAGTDDKCAFLERELGVAKAINYRNKAQGAGGGGGGWASELLAATGARGVDRIVDFVGGSYLQQNLDAVARDGRICLLGLLGGGTADQVDIGKLLYKRARIEGSTLRSRDEAYQARLRDRLRGYLPRFETGELRIFLDTVLPWEEIAAAHRRMEENKTTGKIVCTIVS